jgi:hypothetical protein
MGSSVVLAEATAGEPPTKNAIDRDLGDDINGNPWFFNFENDHAGDGGPIPQVQHDAIVEATRVVLNHYALSPGNVISHAEWTRRKGDPYWNGDRRCIETIRQALEDEVIDRNTKADEGNPDLAADVTAMRAAGVMSTHTQPGGVAFNDELAHFLVEFEDYLKRKYGLGSGSDPDHSHTATIESTVRLQ